MPRVSVFALISVLSWPPFAGYGAALPAQLLGRWQVAEVQVNRASERRLDYQYNDPRLRWRIFDFSAAQLINDTPEGYPCIVPQVTETRMQLGKLISGSLAGVEERGDATPEDYGLATKPDTVVDVVSIHCGSGPWQGGLGLVNTGVQGSWLYIDADGSMVLRWYGETLLILRHLPEDAKPQASFDCARAATPTERTICGSLQLAAFDRSVASAYRDAYDQFTSDRASVDPLARLQRRWLRQRDACGADATCLLKSMKRQIDALDNLPEVAE
ncbi:MAG: hypothetical protein KGK04_11910 [Xanthomonadaceae bacterium]|nr:hypothetical protein [Xanthomonadaceae bacterium]